MKIDKMAIAISIAKSLKKEIDESATTAALQRIKTWGVTNVRLFEQVNREVHH